MRTLAEVGSAVQRDLWTTPEEAQRFGMIDGIASIAGRKAEPITRSLGSPEIKAS